MLKIGVIVGREWSWPPAFIEERSVIHEKPDQT